jgi:microcystin-dependent protein
VRSAFALRAIYIIMEDRYLGEIILWSGWRLPKHFKWCDGSELEVNSYMALYSVLCKDGDYNNAGGKTFNLPNIPNVGNYRYIICVEGNYPAPD